jgi:hypothetical protein
MQQKIYVGQRVTYNRPASRVMIGPNVSNRIVPGGTFSAVVTEVYEWGINLRVDDKRRPNASLKWNQVAARVQP